jgi:hypothetical protein
MMVLEVLFRKTCVCEATFKLQVIPVQTNLEFPFV